MINRVVLVGRLTRDPELTYTPNGIAKVRFTVAVNRSFSNQNGDREADFISCIAWRKQAENLANFMRKGGLLGVEGRIQTSSYEGRDGKRVFNTDIVADSVQFLEPKNRASGGGAPEPQYQPQHQNPPQQQQEYYNRPIPEDEANSSYERRMEEYRRMQQQTPQNTDDPFASSGQSTSAIEDDLPF